MRIFVAQLNPIVGDIAGNTKKVLNVIEKAKREKADVVLFPELTLCGYPPEDLVFFSSFIKEMEKSIKSIVDLSHNLFIVVGLIRKAPPQKEKDLYNSAAIIADGKILGFKDKTLLPTYDVFEETRYFAPGEKQQVWEYKGKKIGVLICEDAWAISGLIKYTKYARDPVKEMGKLKPDLVLTLAASPYYFQKFDIKINAYRAAAEALQTPFFVANQVGGNDQLVFDGRSLYVNEKGEVLQMGKGFVEDDLIVDLEGGSYLCDLRVDPIKDLYAALVLGVKDYFGKLGFNKACIGLSGGIDSALTACIAVDALGPHNVLALSMPARFSSLASMEDSHLMAEKLRIEIIDIPIDHLFQNFLDYLSPIFAGKPFDIAEENLQARIRGMILMGVSNKLGHIVLSTGNKSEMAMGYVTIYGDLCGGLGMLTDVSKTNVYRLARWINREREIIPQTIIDKIPSAELKPGQKDEDILPPYEIVDAVLEAYVEEHLSIEEIVEKLQLSKHLVTELVERIHLAEYKRRQGPPGIRVTRKAFDRGRLFPIVQGWIK